MKTKTIAQYKIEYGLTEYGPSQKLTPFVKIYNMNARAYNSLKQNYIFRSEEQRDKHINDFVSNVKRHEADKAERKAVKKAFKNPAKVGDVLYSSWGYDQTNVDFYQVTGLKGQNVVIKKIAGKMVDSEGYGAFAGKVKPVPNSFLDKEPLVKRALPYLVSDKHSYYLNMNSYSSANPCNPEDEHYCSWGH